MAGEQSQSDVTRESFPIHFAVLDALHADGITDAEVRAFDVYQGPYIGVSYGGTYRKLFLQLDENRGTYWFDARTGDVSFFFDYSADNVASYAFDSVIALLQGRGMPLERSIIVFDENERELTKYDSMQDGLTDEQAEIAINYFAANPWVINHLSNK